MENNLKKNLSSEILVETVNFIENRAALFLTTPQLLTPLSILSNDSGLIGNLEQKDTFKKFNFIFR